MASSLTDNIPQWKKDLILRKRTQLLNNSSAEKQLSNVISPTSGFSPSCAEQRPATARPNKLNTVQQYELLGDNVPREKCDTVIKNKVNMVQDSVLFVHKQITNTMVAENGVKVDTDSDSSEELHYGPGIVSKLKSKYLSLTLREKKAAKPRGTILSMRRATSLENLLDQDSGEECEHNLNDKNVPQPVTTRRYTPRTETQNGVKNLTNRYRSTQRTNDSMKRARSVETLHSTEHLNNHEPANEDVVIIDKEGNANQRMWTNDKPIEPKTTYNGQINRPKRLISFMDDAERPPADHVKQTMMLFEGPASRRTKGPKPTGEVAAKVANFKHIIEKEKPNKKIAVKPQITPKPTVQSKTRKVFKPVSKENITKRPASPLRPVSPVKTPDMIERGRLKSESPVNEFEKIKLRATSPEIHEKLFGSFEKMRQNSETGTEIVLKRTPTPTENYERVFKPDRSPSPKLQENKRQSSLDSPTETLRQKTPSPPIPFPRQKSLSPSKEVCVEEKLKSPDITTNGIPDISKITDNNKEPTHTRILSDTPDLILHSSPISNLPSPNSVKKFTENFITTEKEHTEKLNGVYSDICDGISAKTINKEAQQNISKACHSVTFSISDNTTKSHLPKLGTVPVGINRLVPDTAKPVQKIVPKIEEIVKIEEVKKVEAVNEIAKSIANQKKQSSPKPNVIKNNMDATVKTKPPMPVQNKNLTNREITKNFINTAKTFEQPVSKVVVSVKSVEDVVQNSPSFLAKPVSKQRGQEQPTMLFNFQDRDTVPDYIAHDNITQSRRGKREKPKAGESGIILLADAPTDEFLDEDDDEFLRGPPSPCDVHFVNDNILIAGRSNISKEPKRQKLRIKFDDEATQLFLYPSESSFLDETTPPGNAPTSPPGSQNHSPPIPTTPPPTGHTVPSLSGSSLSTYQPSKSIPSSFQLGVTRTKHQPIVTAPARDSAGSPVSEPDLPVSYSSETSAGDILF